MTRKLTKPIAFLSAVAMLLTMLLYLPSGVFSDIGLGLSASAETITPTEPSKDANGVYQITSAAELYWFAGLVNGTLDGVTKDNSANAKLMNDITVNENLLASLEYDSEGNVTNGSDFTKWTPISDYSSNIWSDYKGTFDGNGKTISGLFFDNSTTNYVGLFGYIGSGKVTGVKVADSYIRGNSWVGGVCGRNDSGEITNCGNSGKVVGTDNVGGVCGYNDSSAKDLTGCYNEGTVIGSGDYVGGVCGENYVGISGCYNTGSVSGDWSVGGVCGVVYGEVLNCYNTGDISGSGKRVGGVCGYTNSANATITNCYNTGSVITSGDNVGGVCGDLRGEMTGCYNTGKVSTTGIEVGGVCGFNTGTVKSCYNLGNVSGKTNIGGVCGCNEGSTIVNCYSLGEVSGDEYIGGVCGNNGGAIANCYFNSTKYTGNAIGNDYSQNTVNVSGKASASFANGEVAYLLSQGHTVGEGESAVVYDGSVWGQNFETDEYPVIGGDKVYCNTAYIDCINSTVSVYSNTEEEVHIGHEAVGGICRYCGKIVPQTPEMNSEGVYEITNAAELYWFAGLVNGTLSDVTRNSSASAKLMNDITVNENLLASLGYNQEGNVSNGESFTSWTPIGKSSASYKGTFDGNGKTVSGLFYDNSTTDYVGLFGFIGSGKVTGVKVADSYIRGKNYVGGVCGRNDSGEITNCSNSGTVVGTEYVGGVCGNNYETAKDITDCYNEGTVIGTGNYIGGVCGYNYVDTNGCYNTGNISGNWYVGGVCGSVKGELINCYNTGDISATGSRVGGVCGTTNSADAKITGCYNTGNITSTVDDKFQIGGVCGYFNGKMTDCYNTGKVITSGEDAGGVCGYNYGTIKNCYNLGDVSGKTYVGGVCGWTETDSKTVNCYSLGGVSASSEVGGVCGINCGAIANCHFNSSNYTGEAVGDDFSGNSVNVSGKAAASFANGEVAYLLSQGCTIGEGESAVVYDGSVWGQNLETEDYPVLGGDKVYQNETYAGCIHKPGDIIYVYGNESKAATYASFTEVTDKAVPATCTESGLTEGSHCSVCGKVFVAQETVKATGHSYTTKVVAPTYAAKGYTLHKCSCGDSYKDNYTAQLVLGNVTGLKMTSNAPASISMSWTKVPDATGYVVYQAINGKWERIKVTSGNTLTVSNLKAGTNYRFTVKAYKTVSGKNYYCAGYTGVWMTTTPAKPAAKMTVNTPQAIRLEWGKVTGATGYVVYQQVNGSWVKKAVTTNNVYVATGLKSGTKYNFAVRAYRTFNGKNYYSPFATATDTIKTCTKPATVNFTLTAGSKKATVNWSKVTGATGYIVYYKTSANGSWQRLTTTTGTSHTKTGLTTGKTYYFTVKAYKTYNGKTYDASFTTKSVKVK